MQTQSMIVKKPLMYYDNIELVEFRYGDLLLPSDIYHFIQEGIKTSSTVIVPANFFEYWSESDDKKYWLFEAKEYIKLYRTINNEKGIRLFIAPLLVDKELIPVIKFPKGIDEYVDKDPNLYHDTGWLVVDYNKRDGWWVVRKKIYMDLDDIPNVAKYKGDGKTFFFGILTYFPDVEYKIAFSDDKINKALSTLPQDVRELLSSTEKCWSWLLNYLDDVKVVYLFGKGHDVAVGYAVTDWLAYFVAGVVK